MLQGHPVIKELLAFSGSCGVCWHLLQNFTSINGMKDTELRVSSRKKGFSTICALSERRASNSFLHIEQVLFMYTSFLYPLTPCR